MSLKGKVAIVTGGNSGIGQAIVLELARQHVNVVIDYVCHPEATEALEREVGNSVISRLASKPMSATSPTSRCSSTRR
jgi:NAD(P)-dependent dehydrogenase (short-subunit alcohol dehydrogenase family)